MNVHRESPDMLKHALEYAAQGLTVFPCHTIRDGACSCGNPECGRQAKHPMTKNGLKDATTDQGTITEWWTRWPDANIAYAPSENVGIVDVDIKHEQGKFGDESKSELETAHGNFPDTVLSLTGGGGLQYFYTTDKPMKNATDVMPGIDIRSKGGYVILPPSMHASGRRYEWEAMSDPADVPMAAIPDWLYEALSAKKDRPAAQSAPTQVVAEGARNDTLFRLASSLRGKGLSEAAILAALMEENKSRCHPPLPDSEIRTIAKSAGKYPQGDTNAKAQDSVRPGDFSDTGNAEVFERKYKNNSLWTRGGGWFVWDGKRWEQSDQRAVGLARKLSKLMLEEALTMFTAAQKRNAELTLSFSDPSTIDEGMAEQVKKEVSLSKSYLSHAQKTRQKTRTDAMLSLAQSGLIHDLSELDPNPLDLNTPGGIVNLVTGAMRPHSPGAMCSKITSTPPGTSGKQMWSELLNTVTDGDDKLSSFLQQVAGMALIGKVFHEGIIIAHGGGRNGKSTFFNAIADTLGSYAGHIAVNTLTTEKTNKGAALATLRGKRLVLTGELEEHQRLSVAMLKALASTDTLVAEEKFRAPEEFKQSHSICLFTNHLPRVGSTDGGTWRRLTVVPFDAVISTESAIQNYGEVLAERAAPAILQWCIEGAVSFAKAGYRLIIPERVAIATEEYQAREDWLSNFIAERCTEGDRVAGGELYAAYRSWAESAGEYVRRQNDFVAAMGAAGYKQIKPQNRAYWIGLKLNMLQTYAAQAFRHSG